MASTFLTAEWRYLAMLNYEIAPEMLQPYVPRGTELDFFQGRAYVSLVGFRFLHTKLLGIPIPFHRNFEELNLRFYVRRQNAEGVRRGVVFIKEIVPKRMVAWVARTVYHENYVRMPMSSRIELPKPEGGERGLVEYAWQFEGRPQSLVGRFHGEPKIPASESESSFIIEHYWGYTRQRDGGTIEYAVEHPPWRVWELSDTKVECDIAGIYGTEFVEALSKPATSALLAEGSRIIVQRGSRLA